MFSGGLVWCSEITGVNVGQLFLVFLGVWMILFLLINGKEVQRTGVGGEVEATKTDLLPAKAEGD